MGAVFVDAGTFDQPRLGGPAGGDAGGVRKLGGDVVNSRSFISGNPTGIELRLEGWTLPSFLRDSVIFEGLQPEGLPLHFIVKRWTLGPDILMVVQVAVKAHGD